jgi:putative tricarboxylic transport membrane protein
VLRAAVLLPIALIAFGGVILWQSLATMDYFLVARGAPGPGFLPFWLSVGVIALGAALTVRVLRDAGSEKVDWPDALGWTRIAMVLGGTALVLIVLQPVGFFITSMLFVGLLAYGLGFRKLRYLLPTTIGIGVFFELLFESGLRVELPPGILSF